MYIPHTDAEREAMLRTIGVKSLDELFQDVPAEFRFPKLDLPPALTEMEAVAQLQELAGANENTRDLVCFLGAGAYNHFIPAAVDSLLRRGEFFTAYTPYQPEVAQGTLQAIFEYQSLVANLTGMDVSNASHYDGATAAAEAAVLAYHHFRGKRGKIVLSPSLNPMFRATVRTYMDGYEGLVLTGDEASVDPFLTPEDLIPMVDQNTSMVAVQYPDFFGRVFDYTALAKAVHEAGALLVVAVNPTALGMLKAPGEFGADIVVGEGQPLGIPMSFGGPYLGLFATKNDFIRKIAGRLVGETVDAQGRRGYVLTLTAREQHIRREKATSNICTNQGLIALASAVYMSLLGKHGLRKVAELCYHKAHYAASRINQIEGYSLCANAPFFHEFVVCCPKPVSEINAHLLDHGILGGYDLSKDYPELSNHMLLAVTEMNSKEEIDMLCDVLAEVNHE
ncbi:aminomethyl-transferring glycine dehydrogenase subunit GcvPA [Levilinea saccharolytica]|uniref:Probable glycine dehydrogenase (decarboxylating) subunit 1 n=1 Tax=Levilinea saccharolytica TaxID=229921 RepID=A0A0N8GQZ6_9CHLR|nr:aminomethyl-transferring glycine dehydrogenase subunit GcvPA [Levilinea saccharolytica]KPL85082.1 glycine dehydrogenase [Levilinea saccharolytica]GAP18190.1 glycine dehydrogenase (decarboxylating) alpha subunit [Levilinea saccharolytica]